jgi:hypothetical protein
MSAPTCPYCGETASLTTGSVLHPDNPAIANRRFWVCADCSAWVACHPGTITPSGTLADKDLRTARWAFHEVFDPIWMALEEQGVTGARATAYELLAKELGMEVSKAHASMFDMEQCQVATRVCVKALSASGEKARDANSKRKAA